MPCMMCCNIVGAVQRGDLDKVEEMLKPSERERRLLGLDDISRALKAAADKGWEEAAELLLEAGALVNTHDSGGETPLISAAKKGHTDVVRLLIKAGCRLDKSLRMSRATALHWAASCGHLECVRLLVRAGANVEAKTTHGRTPLMAACRGDREDVVAFLLNVADASVAATDREKCTALHHACEEGACDTVRMLLKAGADCNARMKNGDTPIMLAAKRGHQPTLKLLLRQIPLDLDLRGHQMSALHWAAEGGHYDCAKALLKYGSDPNNVTKDYHATSYFYVSGQATPLMLACKTGYSMLSELLLRHGADASLVDSEGCTALTYAVRADSAPCVRVLARAGGGRLDDMVMAADGSTVTPLSTAVAGHKTQALKALLRGGCDVNLPVLSRDGDQLVTPFELALSRGHVDCCKMLIAAGFKLATCDRSGLESGLTQLCARDEQTFSWLCQILTTPPLLTEIARRVIREQLAHHGTPGMGDVDKLPLPTSIRAFVDLQELDDLG